MVITSSTELQTPAPSPARLATPHTDISTESGLTTGSPDMICSHAGSFFINKELLPPVRSAMSLRMKSF